MMLLRVLILLSSAIVSFGWARLPAGTDPKSTLLKQIDGFQSQLFVCPETLAPLKLVRRQFGLVDASYLRDDKFNREYPVRSGQYIDLTLREEDNRPIWARSIDELVGEGFFQNPFISTVYERGYRDNFKNAGFPGVDKEYAEAEELFLYTGAQRVLDLSCASGFMMRRFLRSGRFESVLGADLSPNMLREARRRCRAEGVEPLALVRCDVARLPFQDGSLDAIHAGAAMHCWPRVQESLREVYRVLKPGGALFASTFLAGGLALTSAGRASLNPSTTSDGSTGVLKRQVQTGFQFFESTQQIEGLFLAAGFPNITSGGENELQTGSLNVRLEGRGCVIIKAIKPKAAAA